MSQQDVIKAWKDEEYRFNLSGTELANLPIHPSGILELTDEALDDLIANGGTEAPSSCGWSSCNTKTATLADGVL
jgi:mersacidin/lichenicidin family type 2 lantibiotic